MTIGGSAEPARLSIVLSRPKLQKVKLLPINRILYGGSGVSVGGTGVFVGGRGVLVGGSGVAAGVDWQPVSISPKVNNPAKTRRIYLESRLCCTVISISLLLSLNVQAADHSSQYIVWERSAVEFHVALFYENECDEDCNDYWLHLIYIQT
jgi:hypothetical protein